MEEESNVAALEKEVFENSYHVPFDPTIRLLNIYIRENNAHDIDDLVDVMRQDWTSHEFYQLTRSKPFKEFFRWARDHNQSSLLCQLTTAFLQKSAQTTQLDEKTTLQQAALKTSKACAYTFFKNTPPYIGPQKTQQQQNLTLIANLFITHPEWTQKDTDITEKTRIWLTKKQHELEENRKQGYRSSILFTYREIPSPFFAFEEKKEDTKKETNPPIAQPIPFYTMEINSNESSPKAHFFDVEKIIEKAQKKIVFDDVLIHFSHQMSKCSSIDLYIKSKECPVIGSALEKIFVDFISKEHFSCKAPCITDQGITAYQTITNLFASWIKLHANALDNQDNYYLLRMYAVLQLLYFFNPTMIENGSLLLESLVQRGDLEAQKLSIYWWEFKRKYDAGIHSQSICSRLDTFTNAVTVKDLKGFSIVLEENKAALSKDLSNAFLNKMRHAKKNNKLFPNPYSVVFEPFMEKNILCCKQQDTYQAVLHTMLYACHHYTLASLYQAYNKNKAQKHEKDAQNWVSKAIKQDPFYGPTEAMCFFAHDTFVQRNPNKVELYLKQAFLTDDKNKIIFLIDTISKEIRSLKRLPQQRKVNQVLTLLSSALDPHKNPKINHCQTELTYAHQIAHIQNQGNTRVAFIQSSVYILLGAAWITYMLYCIDFLHHFEKGYGNYTS